MKTFKRFQIIYNLVLFVCLLLITTNSHLEESLKIILFQEAFNSKVTLYIDACTYVIKMHWILVEWYFKLWNGFIDSLPRIRRCNMVDVDLMVLLKTINDWLNEFNSWGNNKITTQNLFWPIRPTKQGISLWVYGKELVWFR